jgi:hypothetical protein
MRGGAIVAALVMACGASTRPNDPLTCGDRPTIEDICVGVASSAICAAARCHDGAACTRILEPGNEAELQSAAASARSGECISLPSGKFGAIAVAGGVSLLGRGASDVTVASITIEHTTGATSLVRGIGVVEGSISASGVGGLELDRVLVDRARNVAVRVLDGSLTIRESTIRSGEGAGVYVSCREDCVPGKRPRLVMRSTWITDPKMIGVWALGIDADLRDVVIDRVRAHNFQYGRGIEASARATLQASFVRIEGADDVAVFISESAGTLGPGIELRDTARGIHLAAIPEGGFVLDGFAIERVGAASIAVTKASRGVIVRNGRIAATAMRMVPVDVGGTSEVGDGVVWAAGVEANFASSVTIGASARVPALIDATAKGTFAATLTGSDATKGIVVEHADSAAEHPALTIAAGTKVVYVETLPASTTPPPAPKP